MKKIDSVLDEALVKILPSDETIKDIESRLEEFLVSLKKRIAEKNVDAEAFVGGSFAKKTMIQKGKYDVDIFLRFDKKYSEDAIAKESLNLVGGMEGIEKVHGSRDYFRLKLKEDLFIEIVPVKKVSKPEESNNITDLSYSHVKYINKKIKSKEILNGIKLAKAFCHANHCYGAESYINGFSGYALELLVYYYKGFEKFLKGIVKVDLKEKVVIDIEKSFKNKKIALMDLNESKLGSPIILIDPTYKYRNALAALNYDTLKKFQKVAKEFLAKPSVQFFEEQKTDLEEVKRNAEKNKEEFILLEAETDRQEGDIAGSKLLKFYNHLSEEISRYFDIKNKGFNYNKKNAARYFFVAKSKGELLVEGPYLKDKKNVKAFEKAHKSYYTRKGKIYSKDPINFSLSEFVEEWKEKNKVKVKEMDVKSLKIFD